MTVTVTDTLSPMLRDLAIQLDGQYTVHIDVGSEETRTKLLALKNSDRDFLRPTSEMAAHATKVAARVLDAETRKASTTGRVDMQRVMQSVGEGAFSWVLLRFRGGKRDVPMRGLSRSWLATKAKAGRPALIGHGLTGDLVRDLASATVRVTKG